jgi:hypothetical protein
MVLSEIKCSGLVEAGFSGNIFLLGTINQYADTHQSQHPFPFAISYVLENFSSLYLLPKTFYLKPYLFAIISLAPLKLASVTSSPLRSLATS